MDTAPRLFRALADRTRLRIVNLLGRGPLCVCDIQRILQQPQSSVSRHMALLRSAGLVHDRREGLWTFYRLASTDSRLARAVVAAAVDHLGDGEEYAADLEDLARLRARGECHEEPTRTVLFACVHNAGRSQMAAAWFNALAEPSRARALSAGTRPGAAVHPEVAAVMQEVGIDLSSAAPSLLTGELARGADLLVTMGCGEDCPYVPGLERADWPLPDPKGRPLDEVRAIRDEVRARVEALLEARGWKQA